MSILLPILILLIVILAVVGIVLNRRREKNPMLIPGVPKKRSGLFGRGQKARIQQFQLWMTENMLLDGDVQQWMMAFSKKETKMLLELLDGYCHSLDMEFAWLFDPRLEKAPVLHQMLTGAVTSYCTILYMSAQLGRETKTFRQYLTLSERPFHKKNQPLVNNLYTALLEEGLAQSPPAEILMKGKRHQQRHIITSIQQVLDEQPAQLMESLQIAIEGKNQVKSGG